MCIAGHVLDRQSVWLDSVSQAGCSVTSEKTGTQHERLKHTHRDETRREKQSFQMACSKKRKVDSENRAFNDIFSYWISLKCN